LNLSHSSGVISLNAGQGNTVPSTIAVFIILEETIEFSYFQRKRTII